MEIKLQSTFLPLLLCLLLLLPSISAVDSNDGDGGKRTYIVRVDRDAKPSIFPTHAHWYETTVAAVSASADGASAAASASADGASAATAWTPGGPIIHTYSSVFHGFSAHLSPAAASSLSCFPGVVAVLPEQVRRPLTTRSPRFLGLLSSDRSGLLAETDFGSDLVVGVIDTGIWPERRSFSDSGLGLVPAKWKGAYVTGAAFPATACNRKFIDARYFSGGYETTSGRMNESAELRSPRDTDDHATHAASIAACGPPPSPLPTHPPMGPPPALPTSSRPRPLQPPAALPLPPPPTHSWALPLSPCARAVPIGLGRLGLGSG